MKAQTKDLDHKLYSQGILFELDEEDSVAAKIPHTIETQVCVCVCGGSLVKRQTFKIGKTKPNFPKCAN
jgi:hypothetical protein